MTWERDSPLVDKGLGDAAAGHRSTSRPSRRERPRLASRRPMWRRSRPSSQVLSQQKAYQRVVAPFDGVITQRNIDVGSLVQADATSGTFMFTIMQSNVIRTQVYVPQDAGVRIEPGSRGRRARARNSRIALSPAR